MGTIEVHAAPREIFDDNGLMGVVLHPDFDRNRWVFLWYGPRQTFNPSMTGGGRYRQLRLSRFTLRRTTSWTWPAKTAKGYSIPKGNFGEYRADKFEQQGKTDLAAQYRDLSKVLPEVYVKGERSNFSIAEHPTRRWLAWGTVNYAGEFDAFNITDHPIF